MKRILKKNSKRGFTLLEVMLATCIMTIVSVMIMKGFLSTMNFAHNNNVYNKMGAKNYNNALGRVSRMVAYDNGDELQDRINYLRVSSNYTDSYTVTGGAIGSGAVVNTFSFEVKHWKYDDVSGVNVSPGTNGEYKEASVVANRHSFFYQPTALDCPVAKAAGVIHEVRYCENPANSAQNGWYCVEDGCSAQFNGKIA